MLFLTVSDNLYWTVNGDLNKNEGLCKLCLECSYPSNSRFTNLQVNSKHPNNFFCNRLLTVLMKAKYERKSI